MQCADVLEAVRLGEESQEVWDHLAECPSCRVKCEGTAFVGDRADTTAKRKPAALAVSRPWLPWVIAGALAPLVGGLVLVAVLVARHHKPAPPVEVEAAEVAPPKQEPPAPKVTPVDPATLPRRLAIDAQPAATVWIDGERRGPTPLTADVTPGKVLLELRADGFHTFRKTVEVGDDDPKPIAAKLLARAGGRATDGAPGEAAPAGDDAPPERVRPERHAAREAVHTVADPPPRPPPPASDDDDLPIGRGFGYLSVNSDPWARVFLDGRDLGRTTPLHRFTTTVGHHTIELRAAAGTVREQVEIKKGEETTVDKKIE